MKRVEGACTEAGNMASSQHYSGVEYCRGQVYQMPQSRIAVLSEVPVNAVRHRRGDLAAKGLLTNGMGEFDFVGSRQPYPRTLRHVQQSLRSMAVAQIHGREEARVSVDAQ